MHIKPPPLSKGNAAGFTLIEIIIALTILGIGLISVMAYVPVALDASRKAADLNKAVLIAQRVIEDIKTASYDNITDADAFHSTVYVADSQFSGFAYRVEINPIGAAVLKDIKITVQWQDKGKQTAEEFFTQLVKYNPG